MLASPIKYSSNASCARKFTMSWNPCWRSILILSFAYNEIFLWLIYNEMFPDFTLNGLANIHVELRPVQFLLSFFDDRFLNNSWKFDRKQFTDFKMFISPNKTNKVVNKVMYFPSLKIATALSFYLSKTDFDQNKMTFQFWISLFDPCPKLFLTFIRMAHITQISFNSDFTPLWALFWLLVYDAWNAPNLVSLRHPSLPE